MQGRHYSGYDHTEHDFATKHPDDLPDAFKCTRFAKSLTNVNPQHYDAETKLNLFTRSHAEEALAKGDISAPVNRTVLWSGGYIPGHPLGYGLGRITAERWLTVKNASVEASGKPYEDIRNELYHTVAMTPAGLPVLNPMWDDKTVSAAVKWEVTPTYIIGFARTARGEITLNVDDTDKDSFFRENELDVIMSNPHITSVRVVRADPQTDELVETLYPNRAQWYEAQKDQWVDSILTRFGQAKELLAANSNDESSHTLYHRMSGALARELYDSYKNLTAGNPLLGLFGDDAVRINQDNERARLAKFSDVIQQNPDLLSHASIDSSAARIALKQLYKEETQHQQGSARRS